MDIFSRDMRMKPKHSILFIVVFAILSGAIFAFMIMRIGPQLEHVYGFGMVELQSAGSSTNLQRMLAVIRARGSHAFISGLWVDNFYALCYTLFFWLSLSACKEGRLIGWSILSLIPGGLDLGENFLEMYFIHKGLSDLDGWTYLHNLVVILKWDTAFILILFLLGCLFYKMRILR